MTYTTVPVSNPENVTLLTPEFINELNAQTKLGEFGAQARYANGMDPNEYMVPKGVNHPPKHPSLDLVVEDPYIKTIPNGVVSWQMVVLHSIYHVVHENLTSYWDWDDMLVPIAKYVPIEDGAPYFHAPESFKARKKVALQNYGGCLAIDQHKKPKAVIDRAIVFCSQYAHNFGHYIVDYFPRLFYAWSQLSAVERRSYKIILPPVWNYYLKNVKSKAYHNYIIPMLASLGVTEDQCIHLDVTYSLEAKELLLPSPFRHHPTTRKALGHVINHYSDPKNSLPQFEKIYLTRRCAIHRRVVNEAQVESFLTAQGFTTVVLEDYTFPDQIKLLQNVRYLVSVDSATLANIFLSGSCRRYLVFTCKKSMSGFYSTLTDARAYFQFCQPEKESEFNWYRSNLIVDIKELEKNINLMEKGQAAMRAVS